MRRLLAGLAQKNLHTWLGGYARHVLLRRRLSRPKGPRHLLFALCDHYEPLWGGADTATAEARVRAWEESYPKLAADFRDDDGLAPRHTFFFPGEQYTRTTLDRLARLASAGLAEVELHLHHDGDTASKLRRDLEQYVDAYATHGHLTRDPKTGKARYAFIHGNWALANGRKDGRWCGVDTEIPLLFDTGCYADYTFPSAPDPCQPNIVNQIYWPTGDLGKARNYERGTRASVGTVMHDRILLIQGPLAIARRRGRIRYRIESAALTANDPPTLERVHSWVAQDIHVQGRPEWVFVKVHTHGAPEGQAASLLGDGGRALHRALAENYNDGQRWKLHYVTAREMFNLAMAAMSGESGHPAHYRSYRLPPPPAAL